MQIDKLSDLFYTHKETALKGRYIPLNKIAPLVQHFSKHIECATLGYSVENRPIYCIKIGSGKTKVLLWSQMHGNESTTTKALFDLLNVFINNNALDFILKQCTLTIVPMLNPDGAEYYTRQNANGIDLNRDAQNLSQPESKILRTLFNTIKPAFCFNLHGQRTIFGVDNTNKSAILSFLSPAEDKHRRVTPNRKEAMAIISMINSYLQTEIADSIGRYDDTFNLNCVGDTFQSLGVPTLLYEAGHYPKDYDREEVRRLVFIALVKGLQVISKGIDNTVSDNYFSIPNNQKTFFDIIIRHVNIGSELKDIGIQYEEQLVDSEIIYIPKIKTIDNLNSYFGHRELDGVKNEIRFCEKTSLMVGNEIVFVFVNNNKITLKLK